LPVKSTIDDTKVTLSGMEVWYEKHVMTSTAPDYAYVHTVADERGNKNLAIDQQLSGKGRVLRNLMADVGALVGLVPVEINYSLSGGYAC
jgi:hypothetical protein